MTCDVVILAGGQGSRLRPVVGEHQKCVADYDGQPFLFHLFACLEAQGFYRIILALGYDADGVRSKIDQSVWSKKLNIIYSVENKPLGTAGALRYALALIQSAEVIVLNGDTLTKLNYNDFMAFHRKQSARLTLAVTEVNTNQDSGYMHVSVDAKVRSFDEKTNMGQRYASMGVYCMSQSFIEAMPQGENCSLENDIFPKAVGSGAYAYASKQGFHDIGTPERYRQHVLLSEL